MPFDAFKPYSEAPTKSGFNPAAGYSDSPTAPQEKPGFPQSDMQKHGMGAYEHALSFAYGAGTDIAGTAASEANEILKLTVGDFGISPLASTQGVRDTLTKVGVPKPGPGEEGFVTAGEWAPAVVGGVSLAKAGAKGGLKALGKIGDFASDIRKGLKPRTLIEGIGKPSTVSDVGGSIIKKVEDTLQSLIAKRGPQAKKLFDEYLAKGKAAETAILDDYKSGLAKFYAEQVSGGKLSPEEAKAIHHAADRISGRAAEIERPSAAAPEKVDPARKFPPKGAPEKAPASEKFLPGMEALDKERRYWNDVASGFDVKGAEAIPAGAAQKIASMLESVIEKHVPAEFKAAMEGYKELSAPINKFNTAIGKKATAKAGEFLPKISKTDPATVPGVFFKSRRSVQELKDLTGDAKFAEEAARAHVANALAGATKADEVTAFAQKNRDWLQEFPSIQKELEGAAKTIGKGEKAKTVGKWGAAGLVGSGVLSGAHRLFGGP